MFLEAVVYQGLILWAAWVITSLMLEVYGLPVISDYEWEVSRGLRQGNQ